MAAADPKPAKRIVDRTAWRRKLLADPLCRSCGDRATNTHHLIGRGQGGDDDVDCLIPLCGSGSTGCHGALHGTPWTNPAGVRRTAADVRRAIGVGLRPSEFHYAAEKLGGPDRACEMLERLYHATVESVQPFRMVAVDGAV